MSGVSPATAHDTTGVGQLKHTAITFTVLVLAFVASNLNPFFEDLQGIGSFVAGVLEEAEQRHEEEEEEELTKLGARSRRTWTCSGRTWGRRTPSSCSSRRTSRSGSGRTTSFSQAEAAGHHLHTTWRPRSRRWWAQPGFLG